MAKSRNRYYKNLGKKIRALRKLNDMTQMDLAKALGMTSSGAISQIENGLKGLKGARLAKVADLFGVHVDVLIHDEPFNEEQLKMFMGFRKLVSMKNRSVKARGIMKPSCICWKLFKKTSKDNYFVNFE